MRRLISLVVLVLVFGIATQEQVFAEDKATLIADSVAINGDSTLVADGNVEIFFKGQRLTAQKIVFDQANDRLLISGPLVLTDGASTTVLASQADLSADLTQGVLTSARMVLQQQLQLAAAELVRVDGRYTALNKVVASSCQVCKANPVPLWEIRARKVVHDQQEQQLYFDGAQFRLAGVPIAYIPRLRLPDPSLKRASGFLIPTFKSSSLYGTGIKVPYFFKIGDHRDLTVTPFFTDAGTRTVELRFRQAFRTGTLTVTGAVTRDDLVADETRGYLTVDGSFALQDDFKLDMHLETVSDSAYLLDYGIGDQDQLRNEIEVSRAQRNDYISGRVFGLYSLRDGEDNSVQPVALADLTWARRFSLGSLGGLGRLQLQTHAHFRPSTEDVDDSNDDGIADGRDMQRISLQADWRRNFMLSNGMEFSVLGKTTADFYAISQDATYSGHKTRTSAALAAELRWPWLKNSDNGVSQVIEPVVQLVFAGASESSIPNEDSALVEFDEGNLFDLSRFPGSDAVETGIRANVGVNYLRNDPNGWTLGVTAGRVLRADDPEVFSTGSGLSGVTSDWMVAWQLGKDQLQVTNRLLFDDSFDMTKAELQATFKTKRFGLEATYVQTDADESENRLVAIRELTLASDYKFTDSWTGSASSRYDFETERTAKAGLGVTYRNECMMVDLSLSRRFTSSTTVEASTDFGISVELLGFGGGTEQGPARACRN